MTSPSERTAPSGPNFVKISKFLADTGISRAKLYLDLKAGTYRAIKHGKSTLIDVASFNAHCASCPAFESQARDAGKAV
jgi:hypothetical protein